MRERRKWDSSQSSSLTTCWWVWRRDRRRWVKATLTAQSSWRMQLKMSRERLVALPYSLFLSFLFTTPDLPLHKHCPLGSRWAFCCHNQSSLSSLRWYLSHHDNSFLHQVKKAYCPPQIVEKNPIVDYCKYIIFGFYSKMSVVLNGVWIRMNASWCCVNEMCCVGLTVDLPGTFIHIQNEYVPFAVLQYHETIFWPIKFDLIASTALRCKLYGISSTLHSISADTFNVPSMHRSPYCTTHMRS